MSEVVNRISNGLSLNQANNSNGLKVTRIETISGNKIDLEKIGFVETDQDISRYLLNVGDILFSNINSLSHIGRSVLIDKDHDLYHGMNLLRLEVKHSANDTRFIFYLINTENIRSSFRARANKAVNQASINQTEIGRTSAILPKINEQQKIADCLSSLDALIAAEGDKLDVLKTHKKGLMQQLFPREGETVPRLRFPEFREAGEWEEKPLADCCYLQAGKFVRASDIHEKAGADRYPCYGGNGLRGYTNTFTHSGTYPLIGRQGAQCGNVNLALGKFHATEHAVVSDARQGVDKIWLFYKLIRMNLNQYATGQAQPGLSVENLDKSTVRIPATEREQQRIATCLSSLDALIAAQADKLDALKTHKKGLMQQLFPNCE